MKAGVKRNDDPSYRSGQYQIFSIDLPDQMELVFVCMPIRQGGSRLPPIIS